MKSFAIGAGVAAALLAALALAVRAGKGGALDPTSENNLAYRGVNDFGAWATGDPHFNLGAWVWEKTHPDSVTAEGRALYGDPTSTGTPFISELGPQP